ncbi:hypothetical protein H257_03128 [Aphanomyces astaci]|uniref:DDE-1 domain-containing protein n=1 Tax=Aphanomyces astaci TaxID=112090 RepID=W4H042_APHAT|nr:hypothetical protein H257_03128 [Aphanomyces astaci]ETV85370.1 hypothetical protein H257_03128 [Aphanomyces astaci]|eukprot:XP_009825388.1 hypothetical protein H257_03128 [Aphanomyces astaci]
MGGQGRKSMIPFKCDIIAYMSERRDNNKFVRVFHLMQWIRRNQKPWLVSYIEAKKSPEVGYESLRCLLLRFCTRNRFRHRKPCVSKLSQEVLESVRLGYAAHFHTKYAAYPKHTILSAKETGLYYDMPPGSTLAEIGKSSKVVKSEKHSERLTALLTIRADAGAPTYPVGHWYAVQANAWMDERVWMMYLDNLADLLLDASVLLVDNLECHVSEKAHAESLFSVIEPLPKNRVLAA